MWQAYIDDSMADGKVLILGGLVSAVPAWEAFSIEWDSRCRHAGWPVFKMAEAWDRRHNEVIWEHTKWHYFTIRDHVGGAICIAVPLMPLAESARKYGLTGTPAANPYSWAFKGIISGVSKNQERWGLSDPIDFIFDERKEENQVRDGWKMFADTMPGHQRHILGRKPIFEDDQNVRPLQGADMWAWWCRKTWLDNGGTIPPRSYPIPWGTVDEIPQIILQWSAKQIDAELARVASVLESGARAKGAP
jgi:hypothetical protein